MACSLVQVHSVFRTMADLIDRVKKSKERDTWQNENLTLETGEDNSDLPASN